MIHEVIINLLTKESAKEVFFALASKFKIVAYRRESDRIFYTDGDSFMLGSDSEFIGSMLGINVDLPTNSSLEVANLIKSLPIKHFGFIVIDITNNRTTFFKSNIRRESPEVSPYRKSATDV